jgi:hypothetical protein
MEIKNRVLAGIVGLSALALLAGCDTGAGTPPLSATSPVPAASAPDPAIRESATANPSFDVGHTVHLTTAGIQPQALVSQCCSAVIFKNESNTPIAIVFNVSKINSGPIAPGATWQWIPPNPESVIYHVADDVNQKGSIQIESPNW